MTQDVIITPASGKIEFKNNAVVAATIVLDAANGRLNVPDTNTFHFLNTTGTAPFIVDSTTKVANLNSDLLDGLSSGSFLRSNASDSYTSGTLTIADAAIVEFNMADGTAPFTVASTTKVSNLNADLLDGLSSTSFASSTASPALTLSGDATGTATFTNLGNATLSVVVSNDSHTHDTRYFTESEVSIAMARALGWVNGYGNAVDASVYYDFAEQAVVIDKLTTVDDSIGAVHKAVSVIAGEVVRYTLLLKADASHTSGLYIRLYGHTGDLPDGKTHVSNDASASSSFVQEDDFQASAWVEDSAVGTGWITYEYEYTVPDTGYVSLVILNWTGTGADGKIWVKQPDIVIIKSASSANSDELQGFTWTETGKNVLGDEIQVGAATTYFYEDVAGRISTSADFYVRADSANTYLYSENTYLGGESGDSILVRGNTISGTGWSITGAGAAVFDSVSEGGTALSAKYLGISSKAADSDKLDALNSTDFVRYIADPDAAASNLLASGAWITDWLSEENVDHVWHDDTNNQWNFNSDTTFKAQGNSIINGGSYKVGNVQFIDGSRNISANEIAGTFGEFTKSGVAGTPNLSLVNSGSALYNHSLEAYAANLTADESNILLIGVEGSEKNAGYIGYLYSADGSDDNKVTIGHFSSNHLFTINGVGKVDSVGDFVITKSQPKIELSNTTEDYAVIEFNDSQDIAGQAFQIRYNSGSGNAMLMGHAADSYLGFEFQSGGVFAATGGTFGSVSITGDSTITSARLTITDDTDALRVRSTSTGVGVNINFSDQVPTPSQQGNITYFHQDTLSYGSGNAFVISGTEASMTILADGKLMFKEGLYVKPATGTGAGTLLISSSGNLTNIGTISSGAITSSGDVNLSGDVKKYAAPVYRSDATSTINNSAFTTLFTVNGDNLGSAIRLNLTGTTTSVVVNVVADIQVGHFQDILITSRSGFYTIVTLKITSDNNEDFAVEAKTNSANALTCRIEVFPQSNESITFTNSHSFTGASHEHTCSHGVSTSGSGGNSGDIRTSGVLTTSGLEVSGTMTGSLDFNNNALTNLNNLTFNDPGPDEGIQWNGGNGWKIYESPDDLTTNDAGNLQFVTDTTLRFTIVSDGRLNIRGPMVSYVDTGADILSWTGGGIRRMTDQGGVSIGADSSVMLHAGDNRASWADFFSIAATTTAETLYCTADGVVQVVTNMQGGAGSQYTSTFGNDGSLSVPGTITSGGQELISGNVTGQLFANVISVNEIYAGMIAANAIIADKIAANAITADKLEISSSASVADSIFFDGPNKRIDIKDASDVLRVRIGQL